MLLSNISESDFITRLPSREHNDQQICVFSPTKLISSSLARCFNAIGRFGQHLIKLMSSTQGTVIMTRDAGLCRAVESRLVSATGCGNEEGKPNRCHFLPPFKQKTKNKSVLDSLKTVYRQHIPNAA